MLVKLAIGMIKFYRIYISPLKKRSTCRFIPTCSQYGIEAINKHGFFKGGFMLFIRILKCNPFGPSGYDPVDK